MVEALAADIAPRHIRSVERVREEEAQYRNGATGCGRLHPSVALANLKMANIVSRGRIGDWAEELGTMRKYVLRIGSQVARIAMSSSMRCRNALTSVRQLRPAPDVLLLMKGTPCSRGGDARLKTLRKRRYVSPPAIPQSGFGHGSTSDSR
jgi:hypothetical protein